MTNSHPYIKKTLQNEPVYIKQNWGLGFSVFDAVTAPNHILLNRISFTNAIRILRILSFACQFELWSKN